MVNLRRIERKLEKKGITNVEVTRHKKDYYVLHICRNNVPVPLFKTDDRKELLNYLTLEYGLENLK